MNSSDNMTKAYFNIPGQGIISSEPNNVSELILSSGARKNNTVANSCVMFAFGVIGNVLALTVLKRSNCDQKRKLFYRMVAGLAMTDLFGIVATTPVVVSAYMNGTWVGGEALCKYFAFMMIFASTGTMMIVCVMAVERLLCIRHPYFYYSRLSKKHATFFLCGSWLVAAVMASMPLMGFGTYILQYPYTWCFIDYYTNDPVHLGYNFLYSIFAMTTITITVSCNAVVLYTLLLTKLKFSRKSNGNSRQFAGYSKRYAECQMVVLLIGITVVFTSCYLPLMVRILLNQTKLIPLNLRMDLLMIRLASMNQLLDPWVYILLRREVVWQVVSTVKKIFCRKKEQIQAVIDVENGRLHYQINSSSALLQDENPNCCVFCFHCMCDPPQSVRRDSTMSYIEYSRRRSCMSPRTSMRKFNFDVSSSIVSKESPTFCDGRYKFIAELKKQATRDAISQQPTPTLEHKPFLGVSEKRSAVSDPQLYNTLIENIRNSDLRS